MMTLAKSDVPSRWVKQIPIKVNVLAWKISMDRLPTGSPEGGWKESRDQVAFLQHLAKDILLGSIVIVWAWFENLLIRSDLGYLRINLVQLHSSSKQVLEGVICLTPPGGVSCHKKPSPFSDSNTSNDEY
ncbi:hypothetical protein Tco_0321593 [Tanacetum coccineum]